MNDVLSGVVLLGDDPDGIYEGITPEDPAGLHPRWAKDIERFGPFQERAAPNGLAGPLLHGTGVNEERSLLMVCGRCGSTMDVAWKLLGAGILGPWSGVVSAVQTSGRGQLRREWTSPPGNMHLSLVLPRPGDLPQGTPDPDPGTLLPLIIGCMVCRFLEEYGLSPSMKWPNDVLVDGRKTAGILVEDRGGRTIAGIGLNLDYAPPDAELRPDRAVPAISLASLGLDLTPLGAASTLVKRGRNWYERLLNLSSPHGRITEIEKRMAWLGENILVEGTSGSVSGRMIGLNSDGGLVVESEGVKDVMYSGSVRPAP